MNKLNISPKDIDVLAGKLDELSGSLSDSERALLLAVFGMASTAIAEVSKKAETETGTLVAAKISKPDQFELKQPESVKLPPLSQAFKDAFTAGPAGSFKVEGAASLTDSIDVSVGGVCVSVGWSKEI